MIHLDSTDFESIKFSYRGENNSGETVASLIDDETQLVVFKRTYNFEPGSWQFWIGIAPMIYRNLRNATLKFEGGVNQIFKVKFEGRSRPFTAKGDKFFPFTNGDIAFQTFLEVKVEEIYHRGPVKVLPGDVVVDIGANYGFFSIYAAERGASKIISVEPYEPTFECMKSNLLGFRNAFCENVAIADQEGEMKMLFSEASGSNYLSKHDIVAEHSTTGETVVKTTTIENLLKKHKLESIDFLKVDCEGGELDLFSTISDSTLKKIKKIVIEYHNEKILDFLTEKLQNSNFDILEIKGSREIGMIYAIEK
jgi:FkbM family methyltransferase